MILRRDDAQRTGWPWTDLRIMSLFNADNPAGAGRISASLTGRSSWTPANLGVRCPSDASYGGNRPDCAVGAK